MKPTEQLKIEHSAIKMALKFLVVIAKKLEAGENVNARHLEQMVEFIKVFSDQCHHGKEEDLLFPVMESAGIPNEGGPIGMMLIEHNEGRGYVKALSAAVSRYKAGDKNAAAEIAENARRYAALLDQHIDKEDNILYLMADDCLTQEKQNELLAQFAKVETEKIGQGKHEEFHKLLESLEKIYLD